MYRALVRRQFQPLRHKRRSSSKSNAPPNENSRRRDGVREEGPIPVPSTVAPIPLWQRLGPLTRAAEAYARAQRRRPHVTQVCTALAIYLCADISAQEMSGRGDYDPARTARSLVIGGLAAIPGYKWHVAPSSIPTSTSTTLFPNMSLTARPYRPPRRFIFLSHNFNYPSRLLSLATKITINQTVFAPLFNTYFFGMQALLSGDTPGQIWDRVRRTVPVSVVNSLKLWPAVTAFNLTFVPLEYRNVFAGVVAVGWQTYLAFLNRQAEVAEAAELAAQVVVGRRSCGISSAAADESVERTSVPSATCMADQE